MLSTLLLQIVYSLYDQPFWYWLKGLPYARHHNPLLITNRSWTLTLYKILKNPTKNKEMDFKNGVVNIHAAGYNGACTVYSLILIFFQGYN